MTQRMGLNHRGGKLLFCKITAVTFSKISVKYIHIALSLFLPLIAAIAAKGVWYGHSC
jgi:hypothetical protein